ncbi:histidine phosphatase family protein [Aliiroseovarius sp. F47248L]|uniref:histidine phosphatase family protein n=1 Tax=Aliiroseovarius sp. F47248L TaxID=2926420 RepID=UPI001FF31BF2|nr:histidine phosphatase family protein [Aliiroseovarius sp. F47248L]MCK0139193.1 histidine phosphatase family protein [Aliiroseovarius sp. F47248L]
MKRRIFLALTGAGIVAACARGGRQRLAPNTTLIILRHGDRTGSDLNDTGRARAKALVGALDGFKIDAIYAPSVQRNLDTAQPLAASRHLPINRLPADGMATRLITQSARKSVVWVGNKGNLREIWEALDAGGEPPLNYGDLFIVKPDKLGGLHIDRRQYGPAV